jgi:exonuclease SbcD
MKQGAFVRLLHTSDWHLGHSFCEQSRAREQAAFCDWLLRTIEERDVDVVIVAGDVFDSPASPNEAFELYYRFLARLAALGPSPRTGVKRSAVVVGGNHDSPGRLDAPSEVLKALSAHVVGGYDAARASDELCDPTGLVIPLLGSAAHVGVVVVAVPFLNDWRIGVRGFDASASEQLGSMHERFRAVYATMADRARARFPDVPLVATGHLTCLAQAGQKVSDEDAVPCEINRVGTLGAMGPSIFDERFHYVALGHIHRGFSVDGVGRIRYAGSPVQVGLAESPSSRRVLLVDVDAAGIQVESVPVPTTRRLLAVHGTLDEVRAALETLDVPAGELEPYAAVRVLLDHPEPRVGDFVREAAARNGFCRPRVVDLRAVVRRDLSAPLLGAPVDARALSAQEAFLFAWQAKHGRGSSPSTPVLARFLSLVERASENTR